MDFWATWCSPCIAEMVNIKRVYDEFGRDGAFEVLGVSLDTDERLVRRFIKRKATWHQIVAGPAEKNPIAKKYLIEGIPATFLIDYEGKVVGKDLRGADLRRAVKRQLRRAEKARATTKVTIR